MVSALSGQRIAWEGESGERVVGRYVIYDKIASGGLGTVHFARMVGALGFARTVVVKRLHSHLAEDSQLVTMFMDEARIAARVRHVNVVTTVDVIQAPGELLIVMEYVHGESVWGLSSAADVRGERVPPEVATSIVVDTLHGLQAVHEATDAQGQSLGIVHRDVSPQNILVGTDGVTRLVDFGIAKATQRLQRVTSAATVKGKYGYMAPEQIDGLGVSPLTDVFATGVVYWELLTGRSLFDGASAAETMLRCREASVPPPSRFAPELPARVDEIVVRALARNPRDRHPSALAMALDLEACVPRLPRSEVGAWVGRTVADTLAERAAVLARMERGRARRTRERPQPALSDADDDLPTIVSPFSHPAEVESESSAGEDTVAFSPVDDPAPSSPDTDGSPPFELGATVIAEIAEPQSADAPAPPTLRKLGSRTTTRIAAALGLAIALIFALLPRARSSPAPRSAGAPLPPGTTEPIAPPVASLLPALPAERSATILPPPPASSQPSTPSSASNTHVSGTAATPSRSSRPKPSNPCSPPYTVDSQGREIFKPECL
jgi:serine/threonine-protein kinase